MGKCFTLLPPGGNWHSQELEGASHLSTLPGPRGLGCPLTDVPSAEPFLIPRGDNLLLRWELRRPPRASRPGSPVWPPGGALVLGIFPAQQERRPDRRPCEGREGEASCGLAPGPRTYDTAGARCWHA
ncbi:unnamed protein product [Rangifer tarandus platyrhynchus]|uniref:Uncharacterized protein n=1 Tax=Rangifer tarandus platyrhynchus TaxID=3082113 RepID=A0AC59YAU3_RANTA